MKTEHKIVWFFLSLVSAVCLIAAVWATYDNHRHDRVMEQHAEQLVMEVNKIGIAIRQDLELTAVSNTHLEGMVKGLGDIRLIWDDINDKIKKFDDGG